MSESKRASDCFKYTQIFRPRGSKSWTWKSMHITATNDLWEKKKKAKQNIASHFREANILTFIMEKINIRNYKWGTLKLTHTIFYAGSVHAHVQDLAGKWCPNPMPAPGILEPQPNIRVSWLPFAIERR